MEQHQTCAHVTTPSLLKISAIERLVGRYDRIVYLDNDILVFDDLRIQDIEMGTAPIAAVIDMDLSDTGALRGSKWSSGGAQGEDIGSYFNVGFMISDHETGMVTVSMRNTPLPLTSTTSRASTKLILHRLSNAPSTAFLERPI